MKGDSDLSVTQKYDNLKIYVDADGDDNYNDEAVSQDFNSATITLTHDDNGNLTFDGLYRYTYDVLNRLVKVCYGTETAAGEVPVSLYEYDGMNRRISKTVTNSGAGIVRGSDDGGTIAGIQAGNLVERYIYGGMGVSPVNWRVVEERDGAEYGGHVLAQTVWSTEYIDAPLCRDRNTDPDSDGVVGYDSQDDCLEEGSSLRYFYHQDLNYRVLALTDESGDVVERYDYATYGEPRITAGYSSTLSGESGALLSASLVGNPYMHQGLRRDAETGLHENRMRAYNSQLGRFMQRDPLEYIDTLNIYAYETDCPYSKLDSKGLSLGTMIACGCCAAVLAGDIGGGVAGCIWGCAESNRNNYSFSDCFWDCAKSYAEDRQDSSRVLNTTTLEDSGNDA